MHRKILVYSAIAIILLRLYLSSLEKPPNNKTIRISGYLKNQPIIFNSQIRFILGNISISLPDLFDLNYGDFVVVRGIVDCKYKKVVLVNIPQCSLKNSVLEKTNKGFEKSSPIMKIPILLNKSLLSVYNQLFPSPYNGIVAGIVIGDKSLLSQTFYEKMKNSGTLHILVASGMNIAMFSSGVLSFYCIFFKRRTSLVLLILTIWFYVLATGAQSPIVRAGIMSSILYFSQILGRKTETKTVLWITILIMLLINPSLIIDLGFQLTFTATAGIVYLTPIFKAKMYNLKFGRGTRGFLIKIAGVLIGENFISSLASFLMTFPILALNFNSLNILSIPINLAVLWSIPYILQAGGILGIFGLIFKANLALVKVASYPLFLLLLYVEQSITLFDKIKFVRISSLPSMPLLAYVYYLVMAVWIYRQEKLGIRN